MRYIGLLGGIALIAGGAYFFVTSLQRVLDIPIGNCFGPDCFDLEAGFVTLPASIIALVVGGIVAMLSIGAIHTRNPGALGGISGLSALGALFIVIAGGVLVVALSAGGIVAGTFVFMAVTFLLTGVALLGVDQWLAARRRRASRLRAAGMRGRATILSVSDSNVTVNNDPLVNLQLQVSIPNHPPYEVTKRQVISRIAIGQFAPGAVLPVLVDPADPTDVMIDETGGMRTAASAVGAGGPSAPGTGPAWDGGPAEPPEAGQIGQLSPDLMATIGNALRLAADQFGSGQLPGGSTTITVNGQTFHVPGGAGQTIVIEPTGRIVTRTAGGDTTGGAVGPIGAASAAGAPPRATGQPATIGPALGTAATPSALPTAGTTSATGPANGRVSIESLHDTGAQLGDMRLFSFELTVSPAGGQPYRISHAALVPSAQVPRLIRGASFPAVIDATLPGGIGIFWDR